MSDKNKFVKLSKWASDLIVDPLSKEPLSLTEKEDVLLSPYGAVYPVVNGIYDLRLLKCAATADGILWEKGQKEYEKSSMNWSDDDNQDFLGELAGVEEVYTEIPITGRCLDIGGHQGRLRAFMSPSQEYLTCDPFISVFDSISKKN